MTEWLTHWIPYKSVCRTAPATPGPLNILTVLTDLEPGQFVSIYVKIQSREGAFCPIRLNRPDHTWVEHFIRWRYCNNKKINKTQPWPQHPKPWTCFFSLYMIVYICLGWGGEGFKGCNQMLSLVSHKKSHQKVHLSLGCRGGRVKHKQTLSV